jgi:hypothetical protein
VTDHEIPRREPREGGAYGRREPPSAAPTPSPPDTGLSRGYARSRERNEAIRAELQPLAPGERPLGLKLAIVLAIFFGVANVVAAALGEAPGPALAFAFVSGAIAYGLWQRSYAVILLFQALLALTIVVSALSLLFAGNVLAVIIVVVLVAVCAPVFWMLVRVMARLQVPSR